MNLQRLFMQATIVAGRGALALGVVGAACSSPQPPPASSADGATAVVRPAEPTPRADEPVRAGSTLWTLQKIAHVDPVYPPEALAAYIEAVVPVEVTIGADGRVENARIVRSIPLLDKAALDAVTQRSQAATKPGLRCVSRDAVTLVLQTPRSPGRRNLRRKTRFAEFVAQSQVVSLC